MALPRTLGIVMAVGVGVACNADTTVETPPNSSASVDVTVTIDTVLGADSDTQSSGVTISQSTMVVDPDPDSEPFTSMEITDHDILAGGANMTFEFFCFFGSCAVSLDVDVQALNISLVGNLDVPVDSTGGWSAPSANYSVDLALTYSSDLIGDGETVTTAEASVDVAGDIAVVDGLLVVDNLDLATIVVNVPQDSLPDGLDDLIIEVESDFSELIYSGAYNTCDLDGDGSVGGSDLTILLGRWNTCCVGDLDGSGNVDGADLTILLSCWSP